MRHADGRPGRDQPGQGQHGGIARWHPHRIRPVRLRAGPHLDRRRFSDRLALAPLAQALAPYFSVGRQTFPGADHGVAPDALVPVLRAFCAAT
jgi:hypothetical protein